MRTTEEAEAASDALLRDRKEAQRARATALAAVRGRRFPAIKWLTIGALSGLFTGGALAYWQTGSTLPWSIVGLSLGMAVGILLDRRRAG
ncbi:MULTISPECIES: hypothetical protein [Luteimonas]|uniref:hypothetical protein n=1 Tax=Luteimonas TaxID=83614 RepID=UPI000C7A9DFC|nr:MULTISPECIES: hypothetical protein [Luteimonas]